MDRERGRVTGGWLSGLLTSTVLRLTVLRNPPEAGNLGRGGMVESLPFLLPSSHISYFSPPFFFLAREKGPKRTALPRRRRAGFSANYLWGITWSGALHTHAHTPDGGAERKNAEKPPTPPPGGGERNARDRRPFHRPYECNMVARFGGRGVVLLLLPSCVSRFS